MSLCANAAPHTSTLLRWLLLAVSCQAPVRALADESGEARGQAVEHLEWNERATCPRPADAEREIARLVGERYKPTDKAIFFVDVTHNAANGFDLALRFRDEGAESARHVRLASCAEVQEAAILLAAMTLQAGALQSGVPQEGAHPAATPSEDTPPAGQAATKGEAERPGEASAQNKALASPLESSGDARTHEPLLRVADSLRLEVQLALDAKSLPRVSAGPSIGLALRVHTMLDLALHGRYLLPRASTADMPDGTRAEVDLFAAALEARLRLKAFSGTPRQRPWVFGPSSELELGALRGHASGTTGSGRGNAVWASLSAGIYGLFPVHRRLHLSAKAHLTLPLQRPSFAFAQESSSFYTTEPVGFRLFFGVSCALGPTD